ncbi:MAG: fructose-bisphosphate aldolase [Streptococcaceae bacterium]|nr:fructose-bisphosphate aldolase [Streptococcaceae bacterium]
MAIVSAKEFIQAARENGYAVGGFNTNNLEWTQAILRAAEAKKAPILIQTSIGAEKYMGGYKTVFNLINNLCNFMGITVPIAIHLDHGDYEAAKEVIEIGYTSLMFDGSHLPTEENFKKTREIVKLAHAKGMSVEAEVGSIGGEEDGVVGEGELAPIDDAVEMIKTGVDFLAAGIGNIHGTYPKNWKGLHLDHLKKLSEAVDKIAGYKFPIVLHGGSCIPDDQIREAIKYGVAKVNVNTEVQLAFHQATREFVLSNEDLKGKNYDPRKFLKPGVNAIQSAVEERIDVFDSANKA